MMDNNDGVLLYYNKTPSDLWGTMRVSLIIIYEYNTRNKYQRNIL